MKKLLLSVGLLFAACLQLRAQVSVTATGGTANANYTTLNAAFTAINAGTHQGIIGINITGNTTEPATTVALLKSASPSNYSSITIAPSGGDWTINSAATPTASRGIIELSGADNVTIDGDPNNTGTRHLSIVMATNTSTGTAAVRFSSNSTTGTDGADNNTIKNCIITGGRSSATSTTVNYGINMSNYSATSMTTGASTSLNMLIQNNLITRCLYGVFANGASGNYNAGLQILNNIIGSATDANGVGARGIYLSNTAATAGTTSAIVEGNDVRVGNAAAGVGTTIYGVYVDAANSGLAIRKNNIHDIANPTTSALGSYGIAIISSTANAALDINNNFIRDVYGYNNYTGVPVSAQNFGLFISGGATAIKFNNNTVVLNVANAGTTANATSSDINVTSTAATFDQVINNILINNQNSTGAYTFITAATTNVSAATEDNNDYYAPYGKMGYYNGANTNTLADWQTATTKDASSLSANVTFTSATNLHIPAGTVTPLESGGSSSNNIIYDIDGDMRPGPIGSIYGGGNAPDMGADEFDGTPPVPNDIAATAFINPLNSNTIGAGVNFVPQASFTNLGIVTQSNFQVRYKIINSSNVVVYNQAVTIASLAPYVTTSVSFPTGIITTAGTYTIRAIAQLAGDMLNSNDSINGSVTAIAALCGTYHVGAAQAAPFNTLTAAVNRVNSLGMSCPVTFLLDDTSYSALETFPIVINAVNGASATNTLTIRPNTATTVVIRGATASALLKLNGANYVTINGSNSGGIDKSLTFNNTGTGTPSGIWVASTGTVTNGNAIKNCNVTVTANTSSSYGITVAGSTILSAGADNDNVTIQNNNITNASIGIYANGTAAVSAGGLDNLLIAGNTVTISTSATPYGIEVGNCTNSTLSQNTVNVLTSASTQPVGISIETGFVNGFVRKNLITGVVTTSTGGYGGRGITIGTGTATSGLTVDNNMIYGVNGSNYSDFTNSSSIGICIGVIGNSGTLTTTTGGINLYYNTVNMYGAYSYSSNCLTAALYVGTGATALDIRDNIFTNSLNNTSTSGTGSKSYAVYSTAANTAFTTINYNDYYVSGSQGVLGYLSADQATLANFQTAFGGNANSLNALPAFVSNTNLHIPAGTTSMLESTGVAITGYTTDYDGDNRPGPTGSVNGGGTAPDLGADEFDGIPAATNDIAATAFINPLNGGTIGAGVNFVPQATFTNPGIATQTNFQVRYKIINSSNVVVYNQTATVASLASNSTISVSFPTGSITTGGTYTIRAIAQLSGDQVPTNDSISGSVTAVAALCGTYHVGAAQVAPFNTLTGAVNRANSVGMSCAVTFLLDDTSYAASETFPIVINAVNGASATNTLTIKPNTATTVSITGNTASALLKLNGANYVIINGSNSGGTDKSLTFNNTGTSSPSGIWVASTGGVATNNTIRNCNVTVTANTSSSYGITVAGSTILSAGADNDNVTIQNNNITNASIGIYANGTAAASAGGLDNLLVTGNTVTIATSATPYGIEVGNCTGSTISQNTVNVLTSASTQPVGISAETGFVNSVIRKNLITGVVTTATGGYGGRGITIATGTATSNVTIDNNMIYGVNGSNYSSFTNSSSMGICIGTIGNSGTLTTTVGGVNIYYNTVNMYGAYSYAASCLTAALYVGSAATALDIRDNVFANSLNNSNTSGAASKSYSVYSAAANTAFTTINYNDYYVGGSQGVLGYLSTDQATLSAFQTAFGGNANSLNALPTFASNTNLHTPAGTISMLESTGVTIAGYATDIDGDNRPGPTGSVNGGGTAPDLGADEFDGIPAANNDVAATAFISPLSGSTMGSNTSFTPQASFTNNGFLAQTNVPVRYRIINSSNVVVYNQTATIASLGVGALATATFPSGTIPAAGTYTIKASAELVSDQLHSNDTITGTITASTPLCGTYHIGSAQAAPYNTITAAINQLNTIGQSCSVTLLLDDASYSAAETFPITINQYLGLSASSTLTIKPNASATVSVTGSSATSLLKLNGADYVTIDGSNNGTSTRNLTITNSSTATSGNAAIWIASPASGNGAVGNTVKNCIIEGNASTTTFLGMYIGGSTSISLTAAGSEQNNNNTISNNLFRKSQYGLAMFGYAAATPDSNNQVLNNSFGTSVTGEGFSIEALHGDRQNAFVVSGNDVQNVKGASTTTMYGIRLLDFKNGKAYNNKVHNLSYSGASTTRIYGIGVQSSSFTTAAAPSQATIYNNMVYDVTSNGTNTTWNTTGILASTGYGDKYYFNSVSLTGQINNSASGLCAAFANGDENITTPCTNIDVRNNVFSITGSGAGGSIWAYYSKATSLTGTISDYNDFYCASTGGGTNYVVRYNGTNYATLAAWQTASTVDLNSASVLAPFTSATDLHIPAATSTKLESGGVAITGINTDIDGQARPGPAGSVNGGGTAPDMGADEFDGIPATNNDIAVTAFISPVNNSAIATNTSFTPQATFINNGLATQTNIPVRYKIVSSTNVVVYNQTATIASLATGISATVTFPAGTITAAGTYTIRAVAELTTDQIHTNDSISGTITANSALCGSYHIGSAQAAPFNTITSAVNVLNIAGVSCPVTFLLDDATYGTSETFPLVINAIVGSSTTNTLTIRPNAAATVSITGSTTTALLKLNGASNVIIDGSNAGSTDRSLTINNTGTTTPAGVWISGTGAATNNNTVKNTNITVAANTGSSYGITVAGTTILSAGADNDNVTLRNNAITNASIGIYANGTAAVSAGGLDNLIITGNTISATTTATTSVYGIEAGNAVSSAISSNTVSVSTASISLAGISLETGFVNSVVRKNVIAGVVTTNTGGYGGRGITIATGSATSNLTIDNNLIYGVNGSNYSGFTNSSSMGICIGAIGGSGTLTTTVGGVNLYYNTVNMYGSYAYPTNCITTAIYVGSAATALDIRDNIFNNTMNNTDGSGTASKSYAIYSAAANTAFTSIDYNDYYSGGTQAVLAYLGADKTTLNDLRTAFTSNTGSVNGVPAFVSNTNLHIDATSTNSWLINNRGIAISSYNTDIDEGTRSTTVGTPTDMGADEFTTSTTPDDAIASAAPAVGTTTVYRSANKKIGEITWGATGTVPSSVSFKYYPGVAPGNGLVANTAINSYENVQFTGGTGYTYTMKLYYTDAEANAIPDASLKVIKKTGSVAYLSYASTVSSDSAGKYVTASNFINTGMFSLGTTAIPLSVKLISFNGTNKGTANYLYWSTASEDAGDKMMLERSSDGKDFSGIATISAKGKASAYDYTDQKPYTGLNYYRLATYSADGSLTYSTTVTLYVKSEGSFAISASPNPVVDKTVLKVYGIVGDNATIRIMDVSGKTLQMIPVTSTETMINMSELPSGIYLINYADSQNSKTIRVNR